MINQDLSKKEVRGIGFPMSEKLVEREKKIMQGTKDCSIYALDNGISMNIAGGTHHAFSNRGEAFCLLNDQAISAMFLKSNNLANKIMWEDDQNNEKRYLWYLSENGEKYLERNF